MVSSQVSILTGARSQKPLLDELLLPMESPDAIPSEYVEFDFSDVFGPAPVEALNDLSCEHSKSMVAGSDVNEFLYDDPAIICSRSHSLVGPSSYVNQSLKLSKLTLHESDEDSLELVDGVSEDMLKCTTEPFSGEKPNGDIVNHDLEDHCAGLEDFEILKVVGQGAFAKVYQVRRRGTSEIYAMKVMRKDKIMEKNHADYMKGERDILTKVDHPFIVQLKYSFQTKYRLYLVLDFVNGGHLFFQLYRQGLFREDLARIYTAEIVSAVVHLHGNGIMHRDLKPENILLGADGHVILTDFGLAKQFVDNTRSNSMCGTLEYMSPEIIKGKGHDKAADWWSVGILLYEMLTGKPPFVGGNRQKIQQKIIHDKIKLPAYLSSEAHSLLKGQPKTASKHAVNLIELKLTSFAPFLL
ncbi:serine/threonine-protein kinase AtPK2/AtPK19-like isoform X2 [Tripterygium wilfordii]|uniref:serine/threonine-protein kinase AtPK2/AtPK19-like isoform X2 n=1 Tax=Tripterygium wilfordii TaxID=458696 RepID=UPI0018F81066|nr:serine/threonine-protein kinase AtPK2/AtPK19-like isoform X2 [Tripterygium wilfordii]